MLTICPLYCESNVVVFPSDLINQVLPEAVDTPIFWLGDDSIYRIVMNKIHDLIFYIFQLAKEMDIVWRRCYM